MGCLATISDTKFPKQGSLMLKRVKVCFYFDTSKIILGTVVRDDIEEPFCTIIRLDDGRHLLTTECQFCPIPE